jgi:hypothetical protein
MFAVYGKNVPYEFSSFLRFQHAFDIRPERKIEDMFNSYLHAFGM